METVEHWCKGSKDCLYLRVEFGKLEPKTDILVGDVDEEIQDSGALLAPGVHDHW